ncbi:MAG: imidazole glycerol phosphate synthase subunit HisF [Methanocellales archaeon]
MNKRRIIPCLDTKFDETGKPVVVKGIEFENLRYAGNPVELAELYSLQGADELVFLDISASIENRNTMVETVKTISKVVSIPLTVGGGIKSIRDIELILAAGADKVSINTAAVKNPNLIKEAAQKFGSQRIVSAIDCKRNFKFEAGRNMIELEDGGKAWYEVVIYSGKQHTNIDAVQWAKQVEELGAGEILLTSKDRDGTKLGYDIPITRAIAQAVDIPVIASGGVGKLEHFYQAFINGASACLAASIFHYGEYTIKEVKNYLRERGIEI